MLRSGETDFSPDLIASTLDDTTRAAVSRIHPALMDGEYLPPLRANETEIARISLASVTADRISVRARRLKDHIAYRIVDEYPEECTPYACRPARSTRPLTLAELVNMIDQAGDDGGPVFSPRGISKRLGSTLRTIASLSST